MGRAVAAASGFLHAAGTGNSREQSELFWSKDTASFLCSPGLTYGGMGGSSWLQESATAAAKTHKSSPGAGGSRVGSILPAWLLQLQWGDLFPHLPFYRSWSGWKQISTEEAPVRKSNKKSNRPANSPITPRQLWKERCSTFLPWASQNPCPWHFPGVQLYFHPYPTPSTAPSTSLCPLSRQPEHEEQSFAFPGHCGPASEL